MRHDLPRTTALWTLALAVAIVVGAAPLRADDADGGDVAPVGPPLDESALPWCVELLSTYTATQEDLDAFEERLSISLDALHNQVIDVRGLRAQVNTVLCASEADADAFEAIVTANPPPSRLIAREGDVVYEILSDNESLRLYCRELIGLVASDPVTYELRGRIGIVEAGDYGEVNDLFNALEFYSRNPGDADLRAAISKLREGMTFGSTLEMFEVGGRQEHTRVEFKPASTVTSAERVATHTFEADAMRSYLDVPYARYEIETAVTPGYGVHRAWSANANDRAGDDTYFPIDHADVKAALEAAWAHLPDGVEPDEADAMTKLTVLHRWVVENIRYGGAELGTRKPTAQVFADGYGRCYEMADVLVTMCRAASIAARVVVGWALGIGGHVWVEAQVGPLRASLTADWQAVDATCPWIGIDERYIALWAGTAPVLYLETPDIRVVE